MPFEFRKNQEITVAVLSGTLDKSQGEELAAQVEREIPKGDKLIVDGTDLRTLTQQGVLHLMTVQRWVSVPDRKRLPLVGFNSTVWRAIVENGSDFFFDSRPTLAEALQSFGASAPVAPPVAPAPLDTPTVVMDASPPRAAAPRASLPPRDPPKAEPWLQPLATSVPPPAPFQEPPPPPPPAAAPAYVPPVASAWATAPRPQPSSGKGLWWVGVVAALLLAGGGVAWWLFGNHAPVVTLSAAATTVEEDGKEPDEITATVQNGKLTEKSWNNLPKGLYFEPPTDDSGTRAYTLRGKAEPGAATATVQLEAVSDGGQHSPPVPFTVTVKEKPMAWQLSSLQSLPLKAGQRIWATSKFLVNAASVTAKSGLPPGVVIERVTGKQRDWQLTGTPTTAGSYPVVFAATSPTGKQDDQSATLEVAGETATPPKPPSGVAPGNDAPKAAITAVSDLDDGMRRFLLDRIENLPSHYSDEEREDLRKMVGTLRQARLVCSVVFERNGQTELSPEQSTKLKDALQARDNATLLKDPACQVVVVGYASRTGNPAANVKISKLRARLVNDRMRSIAGRNADLCGDYGPTDVVDQSSAEKNRAVEVYAGILEPSSDMQANAARFKQDFNRAHGIR